MHVAVRESALFAAVQFDGEYGRENCDNLAVIQGGFASSSVDFDKHGDADDLLYARFRLAK